jgi:hybrid polyketide synthase / nonribosomal peptide synthetase FtdB
MEPVAIIGIGCRFPGGANNPESFWKLLEEGIDATKDVPKDRWDIQTFYDPDKSKSGKAYTYHGGFLEKIDEFDAHFFGISPREAAYLDPQQRVLLEIVWEALEDAGITPEKIAGSNTGVYIGAFTLDYKILQLQYIDAIDAHTATGTMMTMVSNRISHVFDLRGPSLSVDTACSSSLVAVHLACQSIWNNECSLAITGGVNIITVPEYIVAESKAGFLSPDGRCKTFDSGANGYARGEGAGVIVLKPLSKALADGDFVYAVIRGTGVNQDGHTNGITVPRGESQEKLMREVYKNAGISPEQIQYVETHGTGTPIGDPIEANAIANVVGANRSSGEKCIIGSVKTNIGHLEAASGSAGLIKSILILQHKKIPPHLHLKNVNPKISLEKLRIPTILEPWPGKSSPAIVGVNSFGFGGTNAHVVLEEAPLLNQLKQEAVKKRNTNWPYVIPLSARDKNALSDLAQKYIGYLTNDSITDELLLNIACSAAKQRAHHEYRLAISTHTKDECIQKLKGFLSDESLMGVSSGKIVLDKYKKIVFVYTGMGPIWWAMGRQLIDKEPVLNNIIKKCDELIQKYAGWSLLKELEANERESRLDQPQFAQPANFAIQIGLTELWRSWGVVPDAIVGHSVGEVSAVYVAGVLSLEEAVWLSIERGRIQQKAVNKGTMLAISLSKDEAMKVINDLNYGEVSIAAINSPKSVTLSGDSAVLERIQATLQAQDILARFLKVNVAYHSHQMDPFEDELTESLKAIKPKSASIPIFSTVSGRQMMGLEFNANYWWQNVRKPVDFQQAMFSLMGEGYDLFIEIGPHPALAPSIAECLSYCGMEGKILSSLQRKKDEFLVMSETLGILYTLGYPLEWDRIYSEKCQHIKLPTYPWQRERYWAETKESAQKRLGKREHPLLGRRLDTPQPSWENEINLNFYQYLRDHRPQGTEVFPATGYVEMGLACAQKVYGDNIYSIEDIKFSNALFLSHGSQKIRLSFNPKKGSFEIFSRAHSEDENWTNHASGRISRNGIWKKNKKIDITEIRQRCLTEFSKTDCYFDYGNKGFQYGPCFQGVEKVWVGSREVLGYISLPKIKDLDESQYIFHPVLLDACFQIMITKAPADLLPVGIERFNIYRKPESTLWSYAFIKDQSGETLSADLIIFDNEGNIVAEIIGFHTQSLNKINGYKVDNIDDWFYELKWEPKEYFQIANEIPPAKVNRKQPGTWIIFSDKKGTGDKFASSLKKQGETTITVLPGKTYQFLGKSRKCILDPLSDEHFQQLFTEITKNQWPAISGIIHMWSMDAYDEDNVTDATVEKYKILGCFTVINLVKTIDVNGISAKLWIITRGSQMPNKNTSPAAILQTPLWGLGRVIGHQEMPAIWGGLIDLEPKTSPEEVQTMFTEIYKPDGEDQIVFKDGQRLVARLANQTINSLNAPIRFKPNGNYLITGGFGALGILIARWMVENGARRLILMSRTKFPPRSEWGSIKENNPLAEQIAFIKELEAMGVSIHLAAVDVGDKEQLAFFIESYKKEGWPPILGVIHTAGILRDQLLQKMDFDTYDLVLRPKVTGAWNLHCLFMDTPLDFFILFSSAASLMGLMGQINYASGNAYLDGLAHYRRAHGLPALSINWGPWAEVGMASKLNLFDYYHKIGLNVIFPKQGLEVMTRLFGQECSQIAVIPITWSVARDYFYMGTIPPMTAETGLQKSNQEAAVSSEGTLNEAKASFLQKVFACDPSERQSTIETCIQGLVAKVLRFDRLKLNIHERLNTLGLDSMMATEIKNKIELGFEIPMSIVDLLQGLSVYQLAELILDKLNNSGKFANTDGPVSIEVIEKIAKQMDDEIVSELLEQIDDLPEEEIQRLLKKNN